LFLAAALAAALASPAEPPAPANGSGVRQGLGPADLFAAAEAARAEQRNADALVLLDALTRDFDAEVRAEARFRKALLLEALGREEEAAATLRALLDEKPGATRVRLELARILARKGDEAGARRAIRQAQAAGLPEDVAAVVDQFSAALRSPRPFGATLQLGFAPDSNVNRATSARTLDTIIAPLTLSREARARPGLGLRGSGQAFARIPLGNRLALLPRVSSLASVYREGEFNDVSGSALIGLEWRVGRDRLTPSAGRTWRWYGGKLYARTDTVALDWVHPLGRRTQLVVSGSAARANYRVNALQTGGLFDLSASLEHAISPRTGVGAVLGAVRHAARDPGYATSAGYATLSGWRDIGRTTVFASTSVRRTEGDARLFLFPERRREWLYQASGGATFRTLTVHGFAPLVRLTYERNDSTVGLYDYRRLAADIGIARAF
jgi:tetratricopeptide (TPR) repeat protein